MADAPLPKGQSSLTPHNYARQPEPPSVAHDGELAAIGRVMRGRLPVDPARIAELLRRYGREMPDSFRSRLAQHAWPHLLEGSLLSEWVRDPKRPGPEPGSRPRLGELPAAIVIALEAALILQQFEGVSPATCRDLRKALRHTLGLPAQPPTDDVQEGAHDLVAAHTIVDREIGELETLLRETERLIKRAGYRWNWDTGMLQVPSGGRGGRPRNALRDVVKALLFAFGVKDSTPEVRERIARELGPFFSAELLNTSKGSALYTAVENVLAEVQPRRRYSVPDSS